MNTTAEILLIICWCLYALGAFLVWHLVDEREFSTGKVDKSRWIFVIFWPFLTLTIMFIEAYESVRDILKTKS